MHGLKNFTETNSKFTAFLCINPLFPTKNCRGFFLFYNHYHISLAGKKETEVNRGRNHTTYPENNVILLSSEESNITKGQHYSKHRQFLQVNLLHQYINRIYFYIPFS